MAWLSLSLIALIVSLLLVLLFSGRPKVWARTRFLAVVGFQVSGVLAATVILVTLAQLATAPGQPFPHVDAFTTVLQAGRNSLLLMVAAMTWGTAAGACGAFWLTWIRRRMPALAIVAALLWVIPTFLIAVAVQEFQAQIYSNTSLALSGGYGHVTAALILWAAFVLGLRPAAYVFRRGTVVLEEGSRQPFVRTANAKGLSWHEVAARHILRPSLPVMISAFVISFRLMVGSLPLVEYFFGYPGLGQLFVTNLPGNPDLAIAAVVGLAAIFLLLEAVAALAQQAFDPRLSDVRRAVEAA